ncbi:MAG: hypothetical protein Terrestrivirus4_97 [Terrestrivirus sp.]|uniref:Uncharacterized protein n=1 Tax=Terrestrivirus sp. TaxID=2487775 RepID=A0A3G4ZRK1_9VIRU|nr:MAG: hypothetical protein Terrestrivirus4_97 [Terrestrivirus sp.]
MEQISPIISANKKNAEKIIKYNKIINELDIIETSMNDDLIDKQQYVKKLVGLLSETQELYFLISKNCVSNNYDNKS